jgi:hypothetical protein
MGKISLNFNREFSCDLTPRLQCVQIDQREMTATDRNCKPTERVFNELFMNPIDSCDVIA